jgi:hypothetical protein
LIVACGSFKQSAVFDVVYDEKLHHCCVGNQRSL